MTGAALFLSVTNAVLSVVIVLGLLYHRRARACALLPVYLGLGVLFRALVWCWPDRFYVWSFWFASDLLHTVVRLGLAVELAWRVFRVLPNGYARVMRLQALVLAGTAVAILLAPAPNAQSLTDVYYYGSQLGLQSTYASAWLFAVVLAVIFYHGVPTEQLHRDVAAGFVLWCLVAGCRAQLEFFDAYVPGVGSAASSLAYPVVLLAWAIAAWKPDAPTLLSRDNLLLLRPWRTA